MMSSGCMVRHKLTPDALIASSSNRSPRLPNDMSDASSIASGRAMGTMVSAA